MKKFILSSVVVAAASGAFAQGVVSFQNNSASGSQISVNSTPGSTTATKTLGANNYYYEFFYSLTSVATVNGSASAIIPPSTPLAAGTFGIQAAGFTDSGLEAASTATAGRVLGTLNASIAALSAGSSYTGFVIGWSANIGSTFSALQSFLASPSSTIGGNPTYVGESAVGTFTAGGGSTPVPNVLATSPAIPGFILGQVNAVPEPSSIALAALGGLSLLGLRRKKA